MAKTFKATLKNNIISIPFIFAAVAALITGAVEAVTYLVEYNGFSVRTSRLFESHSTLYFAFLFAILPALLTGRELSGGTIRNKLATGTTKTAFFISQLLVNSLITVILILLYFLPTFIFCAKYYNLFRPDMVAFAIGYIMLGCLVITAISTLISVMSDRMIISLAVSLFAFLGLFFVDIWLGNNLSQPRYDEYYFEEQDFEDAENVPLESRSDVEKSLNPYFVSSKAERTLLWTAKRLMPFEMILEGTAFLEEQVTSQDFLKESLEGAKRRSECYPVFLERNEHMFYTPLYSIGVIAVTTALGLFLFKRRNIK